MLSLTDIVIDKEFESLIPPLTEDERTQLMVNIQRDGFRDSLVVWMNQAILLDGHNRLHLWQDVFADDGKIEEPSIVEMAFKTREDAKLWIVRQQLGRRNLSPAARVQLALMLKPSLQAKAKENQKASGGDRKSEKSVCPKSDTPIGRVDDEIAKAAGVGKDTVRKVETVLKSGIDEVRADVLAGKVSVNKAASVASLAPAEQKKAVESKYEVVPLPDRQWCVGDDVAKFDALFHKLSHNWTTPSDRKAIQLFFTQNAKVMETWQP